MEQIAQPAGYQTGEERPEGISAEPEFISGWRAVLLNLRIQCTVFGRVLRKISNPWKAWKIYHSMAKLQLNYLGKPARRFARVSGRYFDQNISAGWPSVTFDHWIDAEIERRINPGPALCDQKVVFLAITKKCPLRCEHCFEWDILNQRDVLSQEDIRLMVHKFQAEGVMQLQFSGGEPLLRVKELCEVVRTARGDTDFWMVTSGYGLTPGLAREMKEAGFTGVCVSIDHFDPELHNKFRGNSKSFDHAREGALNVVEAGMVLCLNVCVTREMASFSALNRYMEMGRELGASFIQLLEPRAVGHWAGEDVELAPDHFKVLETFMEEVNYSPGYGEHPVITYHGWHQRRIGCFGAGNRFLYVDTDGDLHNCPFCRKKGPSILEEELHTAIGTLRANSCGAFGKAPMI